jgi:hypothetical protein
MAYRRTSTFGLNQPTIDLRLDKLEQWRTGAYNVRLVYGLVYSTDFAPTAKACQNALTSGGA